MKSIFHSTPRSRRARPQQHEAQLEPNGAFFQPKLTINQPGDPYEREADAVAEKVVNSQNSGNPSFNGGDQVQRMPVTPLRSNGLQRGATPDEEKMPSTNAERMDEDRKIQEKPEEGSGLIQKMEAPKEEEKPAVAQAMEAPGEKQDEKVMTAPEEPKKEIQKAEAPEKDELAQKMDAPEQKEEEKPAAAPVQSKSQTAQNGQGRTASPNFSARLSARKGRGAPLPAPARAQMERGIGADFSQVRIHTDSEAVGMNKDIHAQAFTHGSDVYFNNGKFSPESREGQRLLAHELTHVVQQEGEGEGPDIRRAISTPLPANVQPQKNGTAVFTVNGVRITLLPDRTAATPGQDGETNLAWNTYHINYQTGANGAVTSFTGPGRRSVTVQTTYFAQANPSAASQYGRGTTAADQAGGHTSLRFHEGSHGTHAIEYIRSHPFPTFSGSVGMTETDFQDAMATYETLQQTYIASLNSDSVQSVDCVGTPGHMCQP
jgi:Domain of unknown function (DUF4157)